MLHSNSPNGRFPKSRQDATSRCVTMAAFLCLAVPFGTQSSQSRPINHSIELGKGTGFGWVPQVRVRSLDANLGGHQSPYEAIYT